MRQPAFNLDGLVAIVTGGARGVGRGHARELARWGARVVINDLGAAVDGTGRSAEADAVVAEIVAAGGTAIPDYGDVSREEDVDAMFERAVAAWGRVDIVVNNAGIVRDGPIADLSVEDFDDVLAVHARGSWLTCRAAARHWRRRVAEGHSPYGRLINTTSGVGMGGNVNESNYCAAKASVLGLTLALHMELAGDGITCNAIGPSGNTRLSLSAGTSTGDALIDGDGSTWDPFDPSNSSPVVAWLASPEASHVSGQVLRVYGDRIAVMGGWHEDRVLEGNRKPWDASGLGRQLATQAFSSWSPGWPDSLAMRSR